MNNIDWSFALSDDFPLDRPTYLITSILSLGYVHVNDYGEQCIAVDLKDIRKHTKNASEGCKILVSEGLAKWIEEGDKRNPINAPTGIAIGYAENFLPVRYYFEEIVIGSLKYTEFKDKVVHKRKPAKEKSFDFSHIMDELLPFVKSYRIFCSKISRNASYNNITDKLRDLLNNAEYSKMLPTNLLEYLDCVNSLVYERTEEVRASNYSVKDKSVAKSILEKYNLEKTVNMVPYFVLNYPSIADPKYMNTNIYMLKSSFDKLQIIKEQDKKVKPSKIDYENDQL